MCHNNLNFMEKNRPEKPEINKEQKRLKFLKKMKNYRHNFVEDLPPHRVSPMDNDPNYHRYKCRLNFFVGINADAEYMIDVGIITDPAVILKTKEFKHYIQNIHPSPGFTRKEDIEVVNQFLDVLIMALSQKF